MLSPKASLVKSGKLNALEFSQHYQLDVIVFKGSDWLAGALPSVRENMEKKLSVRTAINSRERERKGGLREIGRER